MKCMSGEGDVVSGEGDAAKGTLFKNFKTCRRRASRDSVDKIDFRIRPIINQKKIYIFFFQEFCLLLGSILPGPGISPRVEDS